jgi:hypothetical protein
VINIFILLDSAKSSGGDAVITNFGVASVKDKT